ncbi:MAG: hypothetical protein KAT34_11130 [Candidatus Aminicenantes bacterium]|nr:hypothetical protein [Candidatus Aminicenantes bacterium]
MKKIIILFALVVLSVSLFSREIMKLSEVKEGMTGIGKTIFKGTKIETFEFKVLGILENILAPGKDIIFVELFSPVLEESGVIAGMSGSPLYIDGKVIGAVAFGFNFAKKPIGGVTPIEDIIETSEYNKPLYQIDITDIKVEFDEKNIKKILNVIQRELVGRINFSPIKDMSPIELIPSNRGFSRSTLSYFTPIFPRAVTATVPRQFGTDSIKEDLFKISPADAVSIPLVRGDFEFAASGTVTYVDGSKVYLFGHPFFNLGTVDFPLHKAEIITVFPSYINSFKLAATKHMIGTVVQDRFSAVQGELGRAPYMIPLEVFLKNRNRKFDVEMVDHPLLTPALTFVTLNSIFSSEYQDFGFRSLRVQGKIFIENERNIIVDDLFSGADAVTEFSGLITAINFFIMNNKEKKIKLQKINFEISGSEDIRRATIENVIIEKNAYKPGELINVSIHLKNERGIAQVESAGFKAPNLSPGTVFYLMVADRKEINKFETKNIKNPYFPEKLNPLIRAINNLRKNNRIYIKLMTQTRGLYIKGYEYSNLPLSLQNVFVYNTSSKTQSKIRFSTITEYQVEVPAVIRGNKLFKLKIKER